MRFYGLSGVIVAVALVLGSQAVSAADAPKAPDTAAAQPTATDLIFKRKHIANVEPGKQIDYKFKRTASDEKVLGQSFGDDITLKIDGDKPDGNKDLTVQVYTGDRARDPQKLENYTINPIFPVFFAQATSTFSHLAGGQINYLQRSFTDGWAKATVEPIKVEYNGKKIDARRISMTPYVGDKFEAKMQGWEGAKYDLIVSDQVPGEIVDMLATYHNRYPPALLKLTERTTLAGVTGLEDPK